MRFDFINDDISNGHFMHLISHCPNLTSLSVSSIGERDVVDDGLLKVLAKHCPHLKELVLDCCAVNVTDAAVVAGLRSLSGNSMIIIGLNGYQYLTDAVLDTIDELFPAIEEVHLVGTPVSPQRALRFIVEHQRYLLKLMKISEDIEDCIKLELRAQRIPCTVMFG